MEDDRDLLTDQLHVFVTDGQLWLSNLAWDDGNLVQRLRPVTSEPVKHLRVEEGEGRGREREGRG